MFVYDHHLRVRYAETDQMSYVYYGNYAMYYDIARTEALRSLGISYKELEDNGVMLPVLENYSKYIKPAKYDDVLLIKVILKELPGIKIRFEYELYREENILINKGFSTLVFVDMETGRPMKAPESVIERFMQNFNVEASEEENNL
ncbi:acyl-CoA thioesterase [Aureibacter tunicatorum]|uniref:Acyl-CoA thioester hydrolase n=1 Tax=Aureibacter tunicatorum TaxID=866807 RepID=A0AAE4BSU3_9BACT|nr:thioesterase family protein [Aureibacter tunicatorum]MDR6240131.1 acyl-CoA thioester hydrolase [Aureibacter tunicatorum]BDD05988.1 thioesterase [Aureibacter tunicatorum]